MIEKIKIALDFMEKNYGNDIEVLSAEIVKEDVKIIWREPGDDDNYFSVIGKSKFGKMIEKMGGEC
jgi:hypothetical protein